MDKNSNSSKDKTTALLLALFFGAWTYLYTYKIDKEKFFIFLGSFLLVTIMFPLTYYNLIPMCLFWVGSIIETASRNQQFYIDYDSIKSTKNKSNFNIIGGIFYIGALAFGGFIIWGVLGILNDTYGKYGDIVFLLYFAGICIVFLVLYFLYVFVTVINAQRNLGCACGSGKINKKCCGFKELWH